MKCIAIDDEPVALSILTRYCERMGGMELQCYSDPVIGIREVKRSMPDLLFLDIRMGETAAWSGPRNPERNLSCLHDGLCTICRGRV